MNKKLVSAAVASALAAPAAVNAEEHMTVQTYGRINNAIQYTDRDVQDNTWGMRNVVSRLGFKAKSDLGNGLSAIGRYEFFTYTNREGDFDTEGGKGRGGINDTRLGYVGLSGSWGAVTIGNQWSAYYDTIGTHLDPTFTVGYFLYSSVAAGPYRSSNTIKYANSFGPVYLEFDLRMSHNGTGTPGSSGSADEEVLGRDSGDNDAVDGVGIGLSWTIGEQFTLAGAYDNDKKALQPDDNKRWGLAGKWDNGSFYATLAYQEADLGGNPDKLKQIQAYLGGRFGKANVFLGYGKVDGGNTLPAGDPNSWILHASYNMGGGFRLYYEGTLLDAKDNAGTFGGVDGKGGVHLFGMRYDFST
jgi:predicted porin